MAQPSQVGAVSQEKLAKSVREFLRLGWASEGSNRRLPQAHSRCISVVSDKVSKWRSMYGRAIGAGNMESNLWCRIESYWDSISEIWTFKLNGLWRSWHFRRYVIGLCLFTCLSIEKVILWYWFIGLTVIAISYKYRSCYGLHRRRRTKSEMITSKRGRRSRVRHEHPILERLISTMVLLAAWVFQPSSLEVISWDGRWSL